MRDSKRRNDDDPEIGKPLLSEVETIEAEVSAEASAVSGAVAMGATGAMALASGVANQGAARGQQYCITAKDGLQARDKPDAGSKRTGYSVKCNEIVTITDIGYLQKNLKGDTEIEYVANRPADRCAWLCLADGRGWILDRHLITHEDLVKLYDPNMSNVDKIRQNMRSFFCTRCYEYTILAVIVVNSIAIGLEIDGALGISAGTWKILNGIFATIYAAEMAAKIFAYGIRTFNGSNWNVFDFWVTVLTLLGDIAVILMAKAGMKGGGSAWTAVVPVLRLLRILRIAKLFRELRVLLSAFFGSVSALSLIILFTGLWFYICACVCTVFLGRKEMLPDSATPGAAEERQRFFDITMSMYTLFEVMTMEGWTDVVRPLISSRPWMVFFFMFFIFVTVFFLLELVTGVVVDRMMAAQEESKEKSVTTKEDEREAYVSELQSALLEKNNGDDMITKEHLMQCSGEPGVQEHLGRLDMDCSLPCKMATLLDKNNLGKVSIGGMREMFSGYAGPLDTPTTLQYQIHLAKRMDHQERIYLTILDALEQISGKKIPPLGRGW
jgi:voltage-gated sodium channel